MRQTLDSIADTMSYPRADSGQVVATSVAQVRESLGTATKSAARDEMVGALEALASWLDEVTLGEAEERYTALFDLSPVCTLNLGYHLFGESYERGALLAGLTRELLQVGLEPGDEIPDHLTVMMRLLSRMKDDEDAVLLLAEVLLPGLRHVARELDSGTDPWSRVLMALPDYLVEIGAGLGLSPGDERPLPPRRLPVLDEPAALVEEALYA